MGVNSRVLLNNLTISITHAHLLHKGSNSLQKAPKCPNKPAKTCIRGLETKEDSERMTEMHKDRLVIQIKITCWLDASIWFDLCAVRS